MTNAAGTPGPLRTLTLTLNLLNTRGGLTAQDLLDVVPGYLFSEPGHPLRGVDRDSAMRKLERDIAALRATGLNVVVDSNWADPVEKPRYRIAPDRGDGDVDRFSPAELSVLSKAANVWGDADSTRTKVLLNKLRGKAEPAPSATEASVLLGLDGSKYVPLLDRARADDQPVAFDYQSRSGKSRREVAPWSLVVRGQALYLWGFDLNRWAPRLFRLSRFRSAPELIAEPGAVTSVGVFAEAELDHFQVAPRLAVAPGAAPLTRLRCEVVQSHPAEPSDSAEPSVLAQHSDTAGPSAPTGWEVLDGRRDDAGAWETVVLREADQVVVLEPKWLADSVYQRLRLAAKWGGENG